MPVKTKNASGMASSSSDSNEAGRKGDKVSFSEPGDGGKHHHHHHKGNRSKSNFTRENSAVDQMAEELVHKDGFDMEELYKIMDTGKSPFAKPILGDVFGVNEQMNANSLLGMMYHSRIQTTEIDQLKRMGKDGTQEDTAAENKNKVGVEDPTSVFEDGSDEEEEVLESMNSKQQLAFTIRNWSHNEENDDHLLNEGAVHALIGLASMEDNFIKKCCVTALCNLSSRPRNREKLLQIGSATGVIQIAMGTRNWKIAKLCAYTLCSLSMHEGGEAVMAGEGAILSLVVLLGLKGYRLLPLAAQSLYNLTCIEHHYKGVERTIKAFLSLPPTQIDTSMWLMKSLVNCCRYSWIRMRIIEDGALSGILNIVSSVENRTNKAELVPLVATCMQMLSESSGCRIEMIQKNGLDILKGLLPNADDVTLQVIMKTLHNIMKYPTLSQSAFELCCEIACTACRISDDMVVMEYGSACLYQLAEQSMRGNIVLANQVMGLLPKLISAENSITQYFSISTAGDLFFMKGTSSEKLEYLIKNVVDKGSVLSDEDAIEGLLVALAKLSQDDFSMGILAKNNLFVGMLMLLLKLQTRCGTFGAEKTIGIAIARIALRVSEEELTDELKKRISVAMISILEKSHHLVVLGNTIAAMRALGDHGICHNEFLETSAEQGGALFSRLAGIVKEHGAGDQVLSRNCCALLAGFSFIPAAHEGLSADDVMETLFITTRSDDVVTRELVAVTICNMTMSEAAAERLIKTGVCEIIATLSGATSESVQELCAKCICNLTCARHLHQDIISHGILQTILLIALVRTVKDKTKLACARAVMNLMSDDTIEALKSAGAIRVFASIAAVLDTQINDQCAQGFLIFTTTVQRREDICSRKTVLQALFLMVKSPSVNCRIIVGRTVCNLLSCPRSQRLAINSGALHVVKIISTMDYPILREAAARVIINLLQQPLLHAVMLKSAPIVSILCFIMQRSEDEINEDGGGRTIFDYSVVAMSCACQMQAFRNNVIEESGHAALVRSCMDGKVQSVEIATEVIRSFAHLSYQPVAESLVDSHMLLAIHILYRKGLVTPTSAEMVAIIVRNLCIDAKVHERVLEMGGLLLFRALSEPMTHKSVAFARACTIIAAHVSKNDEFHSALVEQGIVALLHAVVLPDIANAGTYTKLFPVASSSSYGSMRHCDKYEALAADRPAFALKMSVLDVQRITISLHNLSTSPSVREAIVDGEYVKLIRTCVESGKTDRESRYNIARCSRNLASSRECRQRLIDAGLVELLLQISKESVVAAKESENEEQKQDAQATQTACTVALGYLSEMTKIVTGDVSSLLELRAQREKHEAAAAAAAAAAEAAAEAEKAKIAAAIAAATSTTGEAIGTGVTDGETAENAGESEEKTEAAPSSTGAALSDSDSRPTSKGTMRHLKSVIRSTVMSAGSKRTLLKKGAIIENGVVVNSLSQKISVTAEESADFVGVELHDFLDGDSHDMVSTNSTKHEMSMLGHDYDGFAYKIYDNSGGFATEKGGVAEKSNLKLELPLISTEKNKSGDNHHAESVALKVATMTKIVVDEKSLDKDNSVQKVSASDTQIEMQHEDEDEGYSSSNRTSVQNSRSATPMSPEMEPNASGHLQMAGKGGRSKKASSKVDLKKVVPQKGTAWKGMQGEQI